LDEIACSGTHTLGVSPEKADARKTKQGEAGFRSGKADATIGTAVLVAVTIASSAVYARPAVATRTTRPRPTVTRFVGDLSIKRGATGSSA
jgi:hypothetical protein